LFIFEIAMGCGFPMAREVAVVICLIFGHFCPILGCAREHHPPAMDKRDKFIAELRDEARKRGLSFRAEKWRGKGGHMMVFIGDRLTTVPSREIDPKTARKIRKQLGLN
jgi:hypothetical protein